MLASSGTSTVELWNLADRTRLGELTGHERFVYTVAFSGDSKLLASGSGDGTVRLWEVATRKEVRKLQGHRGDVRSVCFSPDGKVLASAGEDAQVRLWEVDSGKEIRVIDAGSWVYSVAFSPDGKMIATGGMSKHVWLWDRETGEQVRPFASEEPLVYSVAISPDGKLLASAGEDRTVRLWELASGKVWAVLEGHDEAVYSLAFSPDGRTLASVSLDGQVGLWEVVSGRRIRFLPRVRPLLRPSVAFAADSKTLATPGGAISVLLWDWTAPVALSARQQEALWSELASSDAGKASDAVWTLVAAPRAALRSLGERLRPEQIEAEKIGRLIADLDNDRFAVRENAAEELGKMGKLAVPALQRTLEGKPSLEVRLRMERLLEADERSLPSAEVCRQVRAVQVLEHIGNSEAQELLQKLARGAEGARLTREAEAALKRLGQRGGSKH
jgi:dipeptidyl aminopeptidase/acylaminoacyl peptidase